MTDQQSQNEIRSRPCQDCYVCGAFGNPLYHGLRDRLFGAPGEWNLKKCPNPECGLIWLDPMPLEEDIGKAYHNYYTHQELGLGSWLASSDTWLARVYRTVREGYLAREYGYNENPLPNWKKLLGLLGYAYPGLRAYLDLSVMYLSSQSGGRLLDVGCGSGRTLESMQDLGWRAEGVDLDPVAVHNARHKGLEVRLGTLEAQKYPDRHFDAVTMSHLIEHVHDPLQLLRECYRVLKPGGQLVVVTPNSESWGHKRFRDSWRELDPPRHLHIFKSSSLRRLVEKAGFKKLRVSTGIRVADKVFIGSRSIRRTGQHDMGAPPPLATQAWGQGMQLAEWAILRMKPNAGEEITLVVEK